VQVLEEMARRVYTLPAAAPGPGGGGGGSGGGAAGEEGEEGDEDSPWQVGGVLVLKADGWGWVVRTGVAWRIRSKCARGSCQHP
jgi:hypothetical protein